MMFLSFYLTNLLKIILIRMNKSLEIENLNKELVCYLKDRGILYSGLDETAAIIAEAAEIFRPKIKLPFSDMLLSAVSGFYSESPEESYIFISSVFSYLAEKTSKEKAFASIVNSSELIAREALFSMSVYLPFPAITPAEIAEFIYRRITESASGGEAEKISEQFLGILAGDINDTVILSEKFVQAKSIAIKYLIARYLDSKNIIPSKKTTEDATDPESAEMLIPLLEYSRAGFLDLLSISFYGKEKQVKFVESLKEAEKICGMKILKEAVSSAGWQRLNSALYAIEYAQTEMKGHLPLFLKRQSAKFLTECSPAVITSMKYVFYAAGERIAETEEDSKIEDNPVMIFKSYNLAHADVLKDLLDIAPLNKEKILEILGKMDKITSAYIRLFSKYSDECIKLPGIYDKLKTEVFLRLEKHHSESAVSSDLTRLVLAFEDPADINGVTTIHGLKRYLHQKGLKLGFKISDKNKNTNRTVDIICTDEERTISVLRNINYIDFESDPLSQPEKNALPYPVRIAVDAFAVNLLYGNNYFPKLSVFCYGNEVHYYIWFRNHPIFVRIDFSPPLQGGMIDLEYYGISNYEIAEHPNKNLDALRTFFAAMEFDFKMKGTRVQARYDKERTVNFGFLCRKAELLLKLSPFLMDIDWTMEGLDYTPAAKAEATKCWADSFIDWGVLPVKYILSDDKKKIKLAEYSDTASEEEMFWDGRTEYSDIYMNHQPSRFWENIHLALAEINMDIPSFPDGTGVRPLGYEILNNRLLKSFREAIEYGELTESQEFFSPAHPDLFQRMNETEIFAGIISDDGGDIKKSAVLARLILLLERTLGFISTGRVENYEVQKTQIPLLGDSLNLYVLRGRRGIIQLAVFSFGNGLYRYKKYISDKWNFNFSFDAQLLAEILRKNHYIIQFNEMPADELTAELIDFRINLRRYDPTLNKLILPDEKIIDGFKASPGRVIGKAVLSFEQRTPDDLKNCILFSETVSPTETAYVYKSAGVVSTGGGILSHAGLIAIQFNKPAIIISGRWTRTSGGAFKLAYNILEYREEKKKIHDINITQRKNLSEKEYFLEDGDIAVLNADEGTLCILGHEPETVILFENLDNFKNSCEMLEQNENTSEFLNLRGKMLKAKYQLEKSIENLSDAVSAKYFVYEILLGTTTTAPYFLESRNTFIKKVLFNPALNNQIGLYLNTLLGELKSRYENLYEKAALVILNSYSIFDIIFIRLKLIYLFNSIAAIFSTIDDSGFVSIIIGRNDILSIDNLVTEKLEELYKSRIVLLNKLFESEKIFFLRPILRQIEIITGITENSPDQETINSKKRIYDKESIYKVFEKSNKLILTSADGGLELKPLIGSKAANLAEVERLTGKGIIPEWFAVSSKGFELALNSPVSITNVQLREFSAGCSSIKEIIEKILEDGRLNFNQKSELIRLLWDGVLLPKELTDAVIESFRRLEKTVSAENTNINYYAIRSSSIEEDNELAARAGEFETFLYLRGEEQILKFLKKTWSGLWTPRALHNRTMLDLNTEYAGGVIIQRMVRSRVSGVLMTVNITKEEQREIVINAGLGLGEGIVSGLVNSDQITVAKDESVYTDNLRFRYITADKKLMVNFDDDKGYGTKLTETLYHQRFRPALEYIEICELVHTALNIESDYGYPVDIEFAMESARLWILQVRPVATFFTAVQETIEKYPLNSFTEQL